MIRFLRACLLALRMTLRGEAFTPAHYRPLIAWIANGLDLLDCVYRLAGETELDLDGLSLKLDGRPTSLARSLEMIRHNLVNEYPRLMRLDDAYSMMVVQSSNLNDEYRLSRFLESDMLADGEMQSALQALHEHLLSLPQVERPQEQA